jgi:Bacteriophage translational regulator
MIDVKDLVEVKLKEQDDFLKVRETLTRIGVASKKDKTLFQSCHILHKRGQYYVVHFKELFALDGKPTDITENDLARRNAIVNLLEDWGLLEVVNKEQTKTPEPIFLSQIKILSHKEKNEWQLVPKYNIGAKAKKE